MLFVFSSFVDQLSKQQPPTKTFFCRTWGAKCRAQVCYGGWRPVRIDSSRKMGSIGAFSASFDTFSPGSCLALGRVVKGGARTLVATACPCLNVRRKNKKSKAAESPRHEGHLAAWWRLACAGVDACRQHSGRPRLLGEPRSVFWLGVYVYQKPESSPNLTPKFDDPRIKGQPRKARNALFFKRFWRDPSFWVIGVDPRFGGHWTLRRGGGGVCALRRALRLKRCSEVQSTRTPGPGRRRVLFPVSPSSVPKSGVKQNKQQAKHLRSVCA